MERVSTVIGTFSPASPKKSSRLIPLLTITCNLPNSWCSAPVNRNLLSKQLFSLKRARFSGKILIPVDASLRIAFAAMYF